MNRTVLFLIPLSAFIFSGCTSALKKQCEATNWFEHGKSIAMEGKRLNEDSFPTTCEKEGVQANSAQLDLGFKAGMAQYCEADVVFQTGRNGVFFNPEMCNPSQVILLKKRHLDGVNIFCEPENAYTFGSSGKAYNNICPAQLEKTFLKEYNRGRRIYLTHAIHGKEQEILQIDKNIASDENEMGRLRNQIARISSSHTITRQQVYDPYTNTYKEQLTSTEDPSKTSEKNNLEWKISSLQGKIEQARKQQLQLRQEIVNMRSEQEALQNPQQ